MRLGMAALGLDPRRPPAGASPPPPPPGPATNAPATYVRHATFKEPYTKSGFTLPFEVAGGNRLVAALTGRPAGGELAAVATFGGDALDEHANTKEGTGQSVGANEPFCWLASIEAPKAGVNAFELAFAPDCYDSVLFLIEVTGGDWAGLTASADYDDFNEAIPVGLRAGFNLTVAAIRGDTFPPQDVGPMTLREALTAQPGAGNSTCCGALLSHRAAADGAFTLAWASDHWATAQATLHVPDPA